MRIFTGIYHLNGFGQSYSLEDWEKNSAKASPNFLFVMVMVCNLKNVSPLVFLDSLVQLGIFLNENHV